MTKSSGLIIEAYNRGYRVDVHGNMQGISGEYKSQQLSSGGYATFGMQLKGSKEKPSVHKLQAYQKYGLDAFKPGIQVRHWNGISTDNSYENILIGTYADNLADKMRTTPKFKDKLKKQLNFNFFYCNNHRVNFTERFANPSSFMSSRFCSDYVAPLPPMHTVKWKLGRKKSKPKIREPKIRKNSVACFDWTAVVEYKKTHTVKECKEFFNIISDGVFYKGLRAYPEWSAFNRDFVSYPKREFKHRKRKLKNV